MANYPNGLRFDDSSRELFAQYSRPGYIRLHCEVSFYFLRTRTTQHAYIGAGMTQADANAFCLAQIVGGRCAPRPPNAPMDCTGCDHLPLWTSADAQAKAACLENNLSVAQSSPATWARYAVAGIIEQRKLLYEMHAHQLTPAQASSIRGTYESARNAVPSCGVNSTLPFTCEKFESSEWLFEHCTRLTGDHVPAAVLGDNNGHITSQCHQLFRELAHPDLAACVLDDYVHEAKAINEQLMEKLFSRMDDQIIAAQRPEARVVAIAWVLNHLQSWYGELDILEDDANLDTDYRAMLARFFEHIAVVRDHRGALIDALLGFSQTEENAPIDEQIASVDVKSMDNDEREALVQALENALQTTMQVTNESEQEILRAALYDVLQDGSTAATGVPLLATVGEVLSSLADRTDTLTSPHDVACLLAACAPSNGSGPRETHLSRVWALIANIDADAKLQDAVDQTTLDLSGWKNAFGEIVSGVPQLASALGDIGDGSYEEGDLSRIDFGTVPRSTARFVEAVQRAKARNGSYQSSGQLARLAARRLLTGAQADKRDEAVTLLNNRAAELEGRSERYHDELVRLVQALVAERQNEAVVDRLNSRIDRVIDEMSRLDGQRAAHAAAFSSGDIFSQLMSAFEDVQGSIDGSQYLTITGQPLLQLSGADARYDGSATTIGEITQQAAIQLSRGQILSIAADGLWAPTCALRARNVITPNGGIAQIQTAGVLTGPEGYMVSWSGSQYEASSAGNNQTNNLTVGVRAEACAAYPPDVVVFSASACAYVDASHSRSEHWEESNGSDSRTSAAFSSGLFLSNTPVEAPVGSLVVVEMPRGVTALSMRRNVHLVRSPYTAIPVSADADLYLVVNDLLCNTPDSSNRLTLRMNTVQSAAEVSRQLLHRIAAILDQVRTEEPGLVQRGEVLSTELSAIRSNALVTAMVGLGPTNGPPIAVSDYPQALQALLTAFLDRELLRLERAVRIENIDRELALMRHELDALSSDLRSANTAQALLRSLPAWSYQNLDTEYLRISNEYVGNLIRDFVFPIVDIWYPDARAAIPQSPGIQPILDMHPGEPIHEVSEHLITLARDIKTQLELADLRDRETEQARHVTVVSFRRPEVASDAGFAGHSDYGFDGFPPGSFGPTAVVSNYRTADAARAAAVWAAIESQSVGEIRILPEDIYDLGANATLSCYEELPVLRQIGFAVVRPNHSGNANPSVPSMLLNSVVGVSGTEQLFTSSLGPVSYQMDNSTWLPIEAPYLYTSVDDSVGAVLAAWSGPQQYPVIGLSPFVALEMIWSPVIPADLAGATELLVIMELESVTSAVRVPGLEDCN